VTKTKIKISPETLNILKNFATINSNLHVKVGSTINTVSPSKTVLAEAQVKEAFDTEFGIWDMGKFLSVVSLFKDPEFEFESTHVLVGDSGKASVKYYFSDPSLLTKEDRKIVMPKVSVSFQLTKDDLGSLMKAASVLQAPDMCVEACGEGICLRVCDKKDPTAHSWSLGIDSTEHNGSFRSWFKVENLKMIPADYSVEIGEKRVAKFTGAAVSYWVAMESDSSNKA
jgi:hypothetical protein